MRFYIGLFLGAVVVFFWGFFVWMNLAFVFGVMRPLPADAAVTRAIVDAKLDPGLYMHPMPDPKTHADAAAQARLEDQMKAGPIIELQISPGKPMMDPYTLAVGFLHMLLASAILATITRCVLSWASFGARYAFIVAVGLFAAIWIDLSKAIWMGAPWNYQLFVAFYDAGAWILAGVPIAWGVGRRVTV